MHEATRKLLGVLLREMDGFDRTKRSVVIGATNRKLDLDPALLSRFDTVVDFPLPDNRCRYGFGCRCLFPRQHAIISVKGRLWDCVAAVLRKEHCQDCPGPVRCFARWSRVTVPGRHVPVPNVVLHTGEPDHAVASDRDRAAASQAGDPGDVRAAAG